jgi:hypothetical protein
MSLNLGIIGSSLFVPSDIHLLGEVPLLATATAIICSPEFLIPRTARKYLSQCAELFKNALPPSPISLLAVYQQQMLFIVLNASDSSKISLSNAAEVTE